MEGSCQSTESQLGLPKLPKAWLSDFHLPALSSELRVCLCFLVRKTHVSATWKTLLPIAAPMPPMKTSLSSSREFRRVTSEMNYVYARLTPCHLLQFRPSFASATNFQLLTHLLFYHSSKRYSLTTTKHFLCPSLTYDLFKQGAIFQLTTRSHRIVGVNNTSAVRTIGVTAYTTNFD